MKTEYNHIIFNIWTLICVFYKGYNDSLDPNEALILILLTSYSFAVYEGIVIGWLQIIYMREVFYTKHYFDFMLIGVCFMCNWYNVLIYYAMYVFLIMMELYDDYMKDVGYNLIDSPV